MTAPETPPAAPVNGWHQRPNGPDFHLRFATTAPGCEATFNRPQAIAAESCISRPAIARANLAVSTEYPDGNGSYAAPYEDYTVLQQHVLFWDRDRDGEIFPTDTYHGFRELGFSLFFSALSAFIIHFGFSYVTRLQYSYIPDPWFRIYVGGIHKAKHGSDSNTYDIEGRFVPQAFEDMFSKWDDGNKGRLSLSDLCRMVQGNRLAGDPFGWFAAIFEWGTTWLLLAGADGMISKEDVRRVYDGSIFWYIRSTRRQGGRWERGVGPRDIVRFVGGHTTK
ncbi:putative peroxygenase 3 [Echria macrotheca]|uniref:Peroxygenase 3 n=1 Tax=Echria macrotheca TaxID=438768 RepID=A0AAJ0F701_9PEZI|nr:putative peroxygenase 3 [Echria macrotheca]